MTCGAKGGDVLAFHMQRHGLRFIEAARALGAWEGGAMNGPTETPQQAARRLAASAIRDGYRPEALHEYTGPDGNPLHWRIRLKHPETGDKWIRPMRLNGEGFELGEPEYPNGKPLYRLQELATRPHDPVIVVEGEWCADELAKSWGARHHKRRGGFCRLRPTGDRWPGEGDHLA